MVITKNTQNTHLGFLDVFLDGVTAGFTQGGATITIEKETSSIQVDDFGTAPVDVVVQGTGATVEVNFAQLGTCQDSVSLRSRARVTVIGGILGKSGPSVVSLK